MVVSTTEKTRNVPAAHEPIAGIKVIDADTHLTEPSDLWTSRAPAAYKDRVPRVEKRSDEEMAKATGNVGPGRVWVVDGRILGQGGAGGVIDKNNVKVKGSAFRHWPLTEVSPAASFIEPRLDLMDEVGIWGHIMYPNLVGFGGQEFAKIDDPELRLLCATIYNDAMAEFAEESHGRINGMAVLPWWDIDLCVREVERIHNLGLKGVNTNADPQNQGYPDLSDPHWEPLWDVCESLNLPINFHVGASQTQMSWHGNAPWPSFDQERKTALGSAILFLGNARVIGNLIYSGICERHPNLKFVSVESGIGWLPFMLETLDYQAEETAPHSLDFLSMKPSDYFYRQMYACFWFESKNLIHDVTQLGYDRCMFETDFPHPTCLYPDPLSIIAERMSSIDYEDRKQLLSGTAAAVYNLDVPSD
jgi:uncharacterized protein